MTITPCKSKTPNKDVSFEIIQKVKEKKNSYSSLFSKDEKFSHGHLGGLEMKKSKSSTIAVCLVILQFVGLLQ